MRTLFGFALVLLLTAGVCVFGSGCDNKTSTAAPTPVTNSDPAVVPDAPNAPDANATEEPGGTDVGELPDIPTDPAFNPGPSARR